MLRFQQRNVSGNNNQINNYYRKDKGKRYYNNNSGEEEGRPIYYNKTIRGTVFRGLHVIFTVEQSESTKLDWIKDFGIVESVATHSGCDRGGLHSHVLLLAHCRKDKSVLWNFKKLFRAYFNHHGDVECEGCERLAKYGRSSKCSYGQCNKSITIIQINDAEHWQNCVLYISEREDRRSDVEPADEEVDKCKRHRNDDPYCTECTEYKLSQQKYGYQQRKRIERSASEVESEEDGEEEIVGEEDIQRCIKWKRKEAKETDDEFREFLVDVKYEEPQAIGKVPIFITLNGSTKNSMCRYLSSEAENFAARCEILLFFWYIVK